MKLLTALFLLIALYAAAQSQVPATAIAPEDAAFNAAYASRSVPKVTGKLLNLTPGELKSLTITYTLSASVSQFMPAPRTVTAQPDGSFSLQLDYALPYQQIWFSVGDFFSTALYADKGLYVELDMKKIKAVNGGDGLNDNGVRYAGADGSLNIYLNNYVLYRYPEQQHLSSKLDELKIARVPVESILPSYNKLYDSLKMIEDDYIAAHPSPYSWILGNERMSDYYGSLCGMYRFKTMDTALWEKVKQHKSYLAINNGAFFYKYLALYVGSLPGERFVPTWKDVAVLPNLDDREKKMVDSLTESEKPQPAYPCTAEDVKRWQLPLKHLMQKIAFLHSVDKGIRKIDSAFSTAKADFLKLHLIASMDINEKQEEWVHILNSIHTPWCAAVAKNEYNSNAKQIADINKTLAKSANAMKNTGLGEPIVETTFGATLYKAPSIKAVDFLAKLKQNFPNKAIIIDRWATWCIPCVAEMPHSKELQIGGKNLPVVFVYLCTLHESSEDKWKRKVMELQQPGIHILIDETLDADLSKYFSFNGYPGYAFIDKSGTYKPGAITWMSQIKDGDALAAMVNN